jgi:copper chaperone
MERMSIKIDGMSCGGCVNSVRNARSRVPGVEVQQVEVGSATLSYDPNISNAEAIRSAIIKAGFDPQGAR